MVKATRPSLLEVINSVTAEDLAELDNEIAVHERALDALKAARKIVHVRVNGKGKRGGAADSENSGDDDESLRSRIHDWLTEFGEAAKPGQIGLHLGIAHTKVGRLTNHEWFKKTPDGVTVA